MPVAGRCMQCGIILTDEALGVCDDCAEEITAKGEMENMDRHKMVYHGNNLGKKYMAGKMNAKKDRRAYQ